MRNFHSHASRKRIQQLRDIRQLVGINIPKQTIIKHLHPMVTNDLYISNGMIFTFTVLVTGITYNSMSEFCTYMGIDFPSQKTFYKCQKKF